MSTSTQARVSYSGDGVTVAFTVPWLFYLASDLKVYLGGAQVSAGFTVSGGVDIFGVPHTGTVTFATAPGSLVNVQIVLDPPQQQAVTLVDGQAFLSATLNQVHDRAVQLSQRCRDLIARGVVAPDGDINPMMALPAAALRANTQLGFDGSGNASLVAPLPTALTQGMFNTFLQGSAAYVQTPTELAAGVSPVNAYVPSHLYTGGMVFPERYGAAGDNATLNDTPYANAMKVAGQMGDGVVVFGGSSTGIWKFANPVTVGAAGQGRRVIGVGRVEWNFSSAIGHTLDLVTISANLSSLYQDQPQFDNIQVQCNQGGRDGVVLTVGNYPLCRNVRVINAYRDGWVESVTGTNWIEKGEFSILVRFAGRNGIRQELLGTAGQNPYNNEGIRFYEVRGVSAVTAGGAALYRTGNAGLGSAAKIADQDIHSVFDAIYNTGNPLPSLSPVVIDTITVQNETWHHPAWENTGTGGNPGSGPMIKVNSGAWSGLNILFPNWNSFWGNGALDAAITPVQRVGDYSFPAKSAMVVPIALTGADLQTLLTLSGQSSASAQPDYIISRTGVANAGIGQGSSLQLGNTTNNTATILQEFANALLIGSFNGGAWAEIARMVSGGAVANQGGIQLNKQSTIWSGSGVPSNSLGANGDLYVRSDTPGTANQRIYVRSAGAYVGIL
jgi:hypothetical protein